MNIKIILILLVIIINGVAYSQWESAIQLTNAPGESYTSFNNARCIASSGTNVHVVWHDDRDDPNYEIYYKRSTDNGIIWGSDIRLTSDPNVSQFPSIAVSGSIVHVVWQDSRSDGYLEIYYKRSTDNGATWEPDTRLTSVHSPQMSSVSVSDSVVLVVWFDYRNENYEIYMKRSTDAGANWEQDVRLTDANSDSDYPSIVISDSVAHVVWYDYRDGNYEIYYKNSTDRGASWQSDIRLTNNIAISDQPTVASSGSNVHVVWRDNRNGFYQIYYKRSTDNGINWQTDTVLTTNDHQAYYPSVAVIGSMVHLVWQDSREGFWKIFYKRSIDNGINWETDVKLTNNTFLSGKPSVAVSDPMVHVIWQDNPENNYEIFYKRNPTGCIASINESNVNIPRNYQLDQNYPNPFNPSTTFSFHIPNTLYVTLRISDQLGREVASLISKELSSGHHSCHWNAQNISSGVYYYRLQAGSYTETKKLILLR